MLDPTLLINVTYISIIYFLEQLANICPSERSKIDEEKLAEKRKMEEEKLRVEREKTLEQEREKRKEKRERVIDELIQTEKGFLISLSLIMETFLGSSSEMVNMNSFFAL